VGETVGVVAADHTLQLPLLSFFEISAKWCRVAAGNTVVLSTSPYTPFGPSLLAVAANEAGCREFSTFVHRGPR